MRYELVRDIDYLGFPVDSEKKWLALEETCRRSLNELITSSTDLAADKLLRLQYMNIVSSAAEELGIAGLSVAVTETNFELFLMSVTRAATKLRLRSSSSHHALTVAVPKVSKVKIIGQIDRLRKLIENSGFDDAQKRKLFRKLDELGDEVVATRVDFARVLALLAYVALGVGGTTAFLADAPEALATITALIGEAKETEDEDIRQIEASRNPIAIPDMRERTSNDDEIPF